MYILVRKAGLGLAILKAIPICYRNFVILICLILPNIIIVLLRSMTYVP